MNRLLLVGIGQETLLSDMQKFENFLIFEQENGSRIRIHVPQSSVQELIGELHTEEPSEGGEDEFLRGEPSTDFVQSDATEFGGDSSGEDEVEIPHDEELESEDEVPSL